MSLYTADNHYIDGDDGHDHDSEKEEKENQHGNVLELVRNEYLFLRWTNNGEKKYVLAFKKKAN